MDLNLLVIKINNKARKQLLMRLQVNIFNKDTSIKNIINQSSLNSQMNMSVYTFISGILIRNNFTIMNLPAYVNFYNRVLEPFEIQQNYDAMRGRYS